VVRWLVKSNRHIAADPLRRQPVLPVDDANSIREDDKASIAHKGNSDNRSNR